MAIRRGDDDWFQIVRWSFYTMVEAEELGITQKNADSLRSSKNPNVRRLLGLEEDLGRMIGLDKQWSYRIIKQVGNYGEASSWPQPRSQPALDEGRHPDLASDPLMHLF